LWKKKFTQGDQRVTTKRRKKLPQALGIIACEKGGNRGRRGLNNLYATSTKAPYRRGNSLGERESEKTQNIRGTTAAVVSLGGGAQRKEGRSEREETST